MNQMIELMKLENERKEKEMKIENERRELELRTENERKERERPIEREEDKRRWKEEMDLKRAEMRRIDEKNNTLSERVRKAGETLKNVLPKMPFECADIHLFFDNVENLFTVFGIDADIRTKLLVPLLTNKARSRIGRITPAELNNYDKVKKFLLDEYKLTPKEYRTRFFSTVKQPDETYQLFASRLSRILNYYVASRKIDKSYDRLCQVMVADRLKECLPVGALQYVSSLEGETWFEPSKVANLVDVYVINRGDYKPGMSTGSGPKSSGAVGGYRDSRSQASEEPGRYTETPTKAGGPSVKNTTVGQLAGGSQFSGTERRCFRCKKVGHLMRDCKVKTEKGSDRKLNVNHVQADGCDVVDTPTVGVGAEATKITETSCGAADTALVSQTNVECALWSPASQPEHAVWLPTDIEGVKLKVYPLQYIDVVINGARHRALIDSGAQIPVIKQSVVNSITPIGQVQIQGVVNKSVTKTLIALDVKLAHEPIIDNCSRIEQSMNIVSAVNECNSSQCDIILPADVVDDLRALTIRDVISVDENNVDQECLTINNAIKSNGQNVNDIVLNETGSPVAGTNEDLAIDRSSISNLIAEQRADVSLKPVMKLRVYEIKNKHGYFMYIMLYHKEKIATQVISQMVLPLARWLKVMEMAHVSIYSGHLRFRKTLERIRLSFFWPSIRHDVELYCSSCKKCQLKPWSRVRDRVPITPIARAP